MNGQTMLVPAVFSSMPQNSSQNCRGNPRFWILDLIPFKGSRRFRILDILSQDRLELMGPAGGNLPVSFVPSAQYSTSAKKAQTPQFGDR